MPDPARPRPAKPALVPLAAALAILGCSAAEEPEPTVNAATGETFTQFVEDGVAIGGYDPVAYFEDGGPAEGSAEHTAEWHGATWRFASAEHKNAFEADPEKYAPQYGGYCAWALGEKDSLAPIDPTVWTVVGDKLYLNYDRGVQEKWLADRDALIERADENWPGHAGGRG